MVALPEILYTIQLCMGRSEQETMASPADVPYQAESRVGAEADSDDAPLDAKLLLRNDDGAATELTVVRRCNGHFTSNTVRIDPRSTCGLSLPTTTDPIVIEVYGPETMAATSVGPGDGPPLFSYRDGSVLVARD